MKLQQLRLLPGLADSPYIVVDTETTGLDNRVDRVIEVAALRFEGGNVTATFETLVNPERDVPAASSEHHHLIADDLKDADTMDVVGPKLATFVGDDYVVAHNASFDRAFLPMLHDREWICSARAARHFWPDAPAHRNQLLRYWLDIDQNRVRSAAAHRAGGDALVTGLIFHKALQEYELSHPDAGMAEFASYVASPVPISILRFGRKHWGQPLSEVPTTYFEWMLGTVGDLDPDLRAAIENEVEKRLGGGDTCADLAA